MQLGLIVAAALVAMWLKICSACADTLCMSPRAGAGARERVQFTTLASCASAQASCRCLAHAHEHRERGGVSGGSKDAVLRIPTPLPPPPSLVPARPNNFVP